MQIDKRCFCSILFSWWHSTLSDKVLILRAPRTWYLSLCLNMVVLQEPISSMVPKADFQPFPMTRLVEVWKTADFLGFSQVPVPWGHGVCGSIRSYSATQVSQGTGSWVGEPYQDGLVTYCNGAMTWIYTHPFMVKPVDDAASHLNGCILNELFGKPLSLCLFVCFVCCFVCLFVCSFVCLQYQMVIPSHASTTITEWNSPEQHGETFFVFVLASPTNRWQLNVFSCVFRHLLGLNICLMPAFPRRPVEPQLWGLPIKCMMIYRRNSPRR